MLDLRQARRDVAQHREQLIFVEQILNELEGMDLPGNVTASDTGPHWYVHSWDDFRAVRRFFKGQVKFRGQSVIPQTGRHFFWYVFDHGPKGIYLNLSFDPPVGEGANCHRELVEMQEVPVYRIVCNKGAGDEIGK